MPPALLLFLPPSFSMLSLLRTLLPLFTGPESLSIDASSLLSLRSKLSAPVPFSLRTLSRDGLKRLRREFEFSLLKGGPFTLCASVSPLTWWLISLVMSTDFFLPGRKLSRAPRGRTDTGRMIEASSVTALLSDAMLARWGLFSLDGVELGQTGGGVETVSRRGCGGVNTAISGAKVLS